MLKSIEGIYRDGKIELEELPSDVGNETRVIVTFLEQKYINLQAYGISQPKAAELRERLASFGEEWDSPEMDIYDDYDSYKTKL